MRNFKYIFIILFFGLVVPSCVDNTALEDEFGQGPNLVSFSSASSNFATIADGEEYTKTVNMIVKGPSLEKLSSPITATISVDPASTAIEGTHYRLESNTITLSPDNDYIALFPIVMLTDGIVPPLAENPTLILNVSQVSGEENIIGNGRKMSVSFNYLCPHDLSGAYKVTIDVARCNNATYGPNFPVDVQISANPDGSWFLTRADGAFLSRCTGNSTFPNSGSIVVVCNVVQPSNNLENAADGIGNITGGEWDEDNGILTLHHVQTFTPNWPGEWTSTYVRQ